MCQTAVAVRGSAARVGPEALTPSFEALLLMARDMFYGRPSLEVLEVIYGDELPEVRDPGHFRASPYASIFDIRKAEHLLDWVPTDRIEDIKDWEF